jgi:hypothetical protein
MSGSRKASQTLGLPDGFKVFSAFPFAGVNQQSSRIAMDDKEFYWLENFIRTGDGSLRTLGDAGTPLYTISGAATIVSFFWFNIGSAIYVAVFLSDGTAVQVAYPSGAVTTISSAANTFYTSTTGQLPACSQYGTQYLVISNNNTQNDYWIWDGSNLYTAGSIGPTGAVLTSGGSGYTSVPSYTVFGGSGSGVVLTPVIANGSVVALNVVNPGSGYLPGESVQVAFSGGGSDSSAILEATLSSGGIGYITLVKGGTGYTNGTFSLGFSGGGGSGAAGTFVVAGGVVTSITLTAGGSGYTTTPTISFAASSGGSGAAAIAAIASGTIGSINVISGGNGFTGTPVITITGGGGSGATATAVMSGGSIASVTVTNGGRDYNTVPGVLVQNAVNHAAAATLTLTPFGISGITIETYQQRIWIAFPNQTGKQNNGGTFYVSTAGSITDFATSDGGDIFTNTDRFLRQQYTFLRQTSNFLYAVGDSSTSVISNVQTSGTPATTTFTYQNTDPQIGSSWRDTAQDFSNTILFANPFGVFGIYGGSVRKLSDKMDNIFNRAIFPPTAGALTPTGAVANIYARKVYLLLMTITDPFTNLPRNVLLMWDQKEWYVASQNPALIYIGTQEVQSNITAWGTDGTSLYPLFNSPSSTLNKIISSKLWGGEKSFMVKMVHSLYIDAVDNSTSQGGIVFSFASIDGDGLAVPVANSVTQQIMSAPTTTQSFGRSLTFLAPYPLGATYGTAAPQVPGMGLGVNLISTSPDFVVRNITLGYIDYSGVA